jgi:calcium/calmodulin-dependent protein kinase I
LGQKLDVELNEFDCEYIFPNVKKFDEEYEMMEFLGEGCLGLVKRILHK